MIQIKYQIKEASRILGIHKDTLRRYEKIGLIEVERGPNDYRFYTPEVIHNAYEKALVWLKEKPYMLDKAPELNHKPLICLNCMHELSKDELVEWDPGYSSENVCPNCDSRNIIKNNIEKHRLSTTNMLTKK